MRKTRHIDIRLAGVLDEDLTKMAEEYAQWDITGTITEDAALRLKAEQFGPGPMGMIAAALAVYREIAARAGLVRGAR